MMRFGLNAGEQLGRVCWNGRRFLLAALIPLSPYFMSAQQRSTDALPEAPVPNATVPYEAQLSDRQILGSVSGVVMDPSGAAIAGAMVQITWDKGLSSQKAQTDHGGQFTFTGIAAGVFQLSVAAASFASTTVSGIISAGQVYTVAPITLAVATSDSEVDVHLTQAEIAEVQLDSETKQRVLGVIPNYYVSYSPNPAPLTPKQKFKLAGRFAFDPVNFAFTGLTAGIQQANDDYPSWGQTPSGYAKRYAADTGTFFTATLLGSALLPSIFKQDPRYFYKGTGSVRSRVLYAIAMSTVAKGDNGHWQANYSAIAGGIAASGIADAYYPARDRDGAGTIFVNAAIGIADNALGNIFQEFIVRRFTPHANKSKANP